MAPTETEKRTTVGTWVPVSLAREIFDCPLQRPQARTATVLHLQLEAARAAEPVHRRCTEHHDDRVLHLLEAPAQIGEHHVGRVP